MTHPRGDTVADRFFAALERCERPLFIIGVCLIVIFTSLRMLHLRADFPTRFARDGVLYTDEGWYASNAIAFYRTDSWHVEGDLNFAVNLPVQQIFHVIFFKIVGVSIEGARLTSVFSFAMTLLFGFFLLRRWLGRWPALIGCVWMSCNFFFFAYSRLALAENTMMMFYVLAALLASYSAGRSGYAVAAAAAVAFMLSFYTKTSAITVLPIILLIVFLNNRGTRDQWLKPGLMVLIGFAIFALHYFFVARNYPEDFAYFHTLNIGMQLGFNSYDVVMRALDIGARLILVDRILYYSLFYFLPVFLILRKDFRESPVVLVSLFFSVSYLGALTVYANLQPRYWVALMVPFAAIVAAVARDFYQSRNKLSGLVGLGLIALIIALSIGRNTYDISKYYKRLEFSMHEMAKEIRREMDAVGDTRRVLLGHISSTVALYEDFVPINDVYGPKPIEWRLDRYRPTFLVTEDRVSRFRYRPPGVPESESGPLFSFGGRLPALEKRYDLREVGVFDVFENYKDYRIHAYQLEERSAVDPQPAAP